MADDTVPVLQLIKCLDHGGAERLMTTMVIRGNRSRFRYEVAFVRSSMRGLVGELEAAGVPVHDLGAGSDLDLAWMGRLRRLLIRGRFPVMHVHLPYTAVLGRAVVRTLPAARRPRLVYTEHSLWPHNARVVRGLGLATARWDDVSIAVSHSNRAALPESIRRRTRVIVHGVDVDGVRAAGAETRDVRSELGIPPDHVVVVSVANLRAQKGYPTLLRAARAMVDAGLPVTFLALGSGPLELELFAEHRRLRLEDRFRFLGQRADALSFLASSDVLVLASDYECMPVVVMEAFALGTPVVATAVGELPVVVEDGVNGLLVPPGRPELLAAALRRLVQEPDLRARLAEGAQHSVERFDVRRAGADVEAIYAQLARL
jgi:glycosyltransferase involved in cell wall biosynthesis